MQDRRGGIFPAGLFVLVVILAAGWAILYFGQHLLQNVKVETTGEGRERGIKVDTPAGSLRVNTREKIDPRLLGVPIYPGARPTTDEAKSVSIESDLGDEARAFHLVAAEYRTPDSVDDVRAFYKKEVPHCIVSKKGIEYTEGGYRRFVALDRRSGETRITVLASFEGGAAN